MLTWDDIAIVIRSHPSRAGDIGGLVHAVSWATEGAPVTVVPQPPDAPPKANTSRWLRIGAETGRPWVLHLEDDVHVGPDFGQLPAILFTVPDRVAVAAFFSIADGPDGWTRVAPSRWCMHQCTAVRAGLAAGFEEFAAEWYEAHPQHRSASDLLLGAWCAHRGAGVAAYRPSLVQHRPLPSTLGPRSRRRESRSFHRAYGEIP